MPVLRVLIIEDSEDDAELIVLELEGAGWQLVHKRVESSQQMLESLRENEWDLVLSDYSMPGFSGLQALDIWKQQGSDGPFIIVSGTIGEEQAVEAVKSGAHDYVLKNNLRRLGPVIDRALRDVEGKRLRLEAEESLRTGLELFRKTLDSQRDAVFVLDIHNPPRIQEINSAATGIFGYSREELVGQSVSILHVDEASYSKFRSVVGRDMWQQGYSQLAFNMKKKDQSVFPTEHVVTPIMDEGGVQSGFVSVVRDITERKKSEQALKESEALFRGVFDNSPVAINVFDPEGNLIMANEALLKLAGVSTVEDMRGLNIFADPNLSEEMRERLRRGETVLFESVIDFSKVIEQGLYATSRQGIVSVEAGVSPLRVGGDSSVQGYLVQLIDVTERKRAEEALKQSEEKFRLLTEESHVGIYIIQDDKFAYVNPTLAEMFGYSSEEIIGKLSHRDLIHPDDLQLQTKRTKERLEGVEGSSMVYKGIRRDGSIIYIEIYTVLTDYRGRPALMGSLIDVTERKKAEAALQDSYELYQLTVESTDDGIAVVALDGHVLEANSRFIQMWAVPESVLQKGGNELLSHMTNRLVAVEGLMSEGWSPLLPEDLGPSRDIYHLKDGRILEVYQAPVEKGGTAIAQLWMFHDITQLERARQSAGLYLDLMCHDIRNRLQVITMNVDLMGMLFAGLDVSSYLSQIQSDVTRCAELIGKAKQTERLEEVPLRLISLSQAVRESTTLVLGHYSDVAVELFLGNSEAFIEANEYLTVLLAQLMQNAAIHNPREAKAIWIRLDEHHEDYELSVADNGLGILDSRKQSLFDSSRRYGGIGLHLAHHIVERYGGRIAVRDRVDGDPSQGADFRVSFPKPHRHQVDLANRMPGEGIVDLSGTVSKTDDSQKPIT